MGADGDGPALARSRGTSRTAFRPGPWLGLIGGLVVFMIVLTMTYVGADEFGGAPVMLLLVPTLGVVCAALGGIVASRGGRRRTAIRA